MIRHDIVKKNYTSIFSKFGKNYPKKMRKLQHFKPYILGISIDLIGIISQFPYISAHFTHFKWVNIVWYYQKLNDITSIGPRTHPQSEFYPNDNNFTQALLVMLVTNIISGKRWHFILTNARLDLKQRRQYFLTNAGLDLEQRGDLFWQMLFYKL